MRAGSAADKEAVPRRSPHRAESCEGARRRFVTLGTVLLLAACASPRALVLTVPDAADAALEQRARHTFRASFPHPARLTQRAVVTTAGRAWSCDGLVQARADGGLRLALLAPLGVIAEIVIPPVGPAQVLRRAPNFPESWARRAVAPTARLLFGTEETRLRFGRLADGRPALLAAHADGTESVHVFSADGAQWSGAELVRGRTRLLRATGTPAHILVTGQRFELELRTVAR